MSDKKLVIKLKYGASARHAKGSPSISKPPAYEWNHRRIALVFSMAVVVLGLLTYVFLKEEPEQKLWEHAVKAEIPAIKEQQSEQAMASGSRGTDRGIQSPSPDDASQLNESLESRGTEIAVSAGEKRPTQKPSPREEIASNEAKPETGPVEVQRVVGPSKIDLRVKVERAHFSWGIKDNKPTGKISSPAILQPDDSVPLHFYSEIRGLKGKSISHVWGRNGKTEMARDFPVGEDLWRGFSSIRLNSELLGRWSVTIRDSDGKNLGEFDLEVLEPAKSSN